MLAGLGIVVIGRNEGERLKACLGSLPAGIPTVYVDSGSTDGSPQWAASQGVAVVELSADKPFSAARARNEGFERLMSDWPDTVFVHFIDGDCLLIEDWPAKGLSALHADENLAVVAGQRLERFPDDSWYNELCAIEWNTPIGPARSVGGDAIYRAAMFEAVGGFDPMMMAGEEPELCRRLINHGHGVERLDAPMTLHDAAIHSFSMWWKRASRSGYAATLGLLKHGRDGYRVLEVTRFLLWGSALPLFAIGLVAMGYGWGALVIVLLHVRKWWRLQREAPEGVSKPSRFALFVMLTNTAEVLGLIRALIETVKGERRILEYKR